MPTPDDMRDFFISYTRADQQWAVWIMAQLESAGYTTLIDFRDFPTGSNIDARIDHALRYSRHTVAVLSPEYQNSEFCLAEKSATRFSDALGTHSRLLPVLVRKVKLDGLDAPTKYIALVGLDEPAARTYLLEQIAQVVDGIRPPLPENRAFPGSASPATPTPPAPFPRIRYLPHPHTPYFTGRDDVLRDLHAALHDGKAAALGQMQSQAISGLGGIGKTQTALEYARRHADEYDAILWSPADSREALAGGFVRLAGVLNLPERETPDQSVVIEAARRWLREHDNWLLILDNANDHALALATARRN